ncbi:MAG TPA: IS30 family transposase [Chromatiaceae bacterium]|nr:IS30 family transposase [Chromatiaceae bacterium]
MHKGYHHLTRDQRCHIYILKNRGESNQAIANEVGVHRSTIYRELKVNKGQRGYRVKQAQRLAFERRQSASKKPNKMNQETISFLVGKLKLQWSPEQISGWMKKTKYNCAVSHETIYRYIWVDKRQGGVLFKELRHRAKKYNKRGKKNAGRGCIPNRVDIDDRPKIVDKKSRIGDWELDTIVGTASSGAIVSMVDRSSKFTKLALIQRGTSENVKEALLECLKPFKNDVLTLTSDNGKEFSKHQEVSLALDSKFFFAKPYHSWQRGLNEHTNGLVRQYFPKNKRFDEISIHDLEKVEALLNNRPRKILKFRSPIEVFSHRAKSIGVALHC